MAVKTDRMTTAADISPEAVESACAFIERVSPDVLGAQVVHIIRALRTELTKAHKTNDGLSAEYVKTRLNLQDAEFALTASEKDAARYRWLRDQDVIRGEFVFGLDDPDSYIDAATEKANG